MSEARFMQTLLLLLHGTLHHLQKPTPNQVPPNLSSKQTKKGSGRGKVGTGYGSSKNTTAFPTYPAIWDLEYPAYRVISWRHDIPDVPGVDSTRDIPAHFRMSPLVPSIGQDAKRGIPSINDVTWVFGDRNTRPAQLTQEFEGVIPGHT